MRGLVAFAGVVFLLAGLAGLIHPSVKMPPKRTEIGVGDQKLKIEVERIVTVPPSMGILAMAAGAGLIFLGVRKPQ